MKISRNTRIKT